MRAVLLVCLICNLAQVQAQPASADASLREFYFQTVAIDQGLAENSVNVVLQDHAGYIWIGSDGPLQRYDGFGFTNYTQTTQPGESFRSAISALVEDSTRQIWVGAYNVGLLRLRPDSTTLERVPLDEGAPGNVHALLADAKRGLWVGGDRGLALIDPGSGALKQSWALPTARAGTIVRQLCLTADGTLWIGTSNGLWKLTATTAQAQAVDSVQLSIVSALQVDGNGHLHIGTPDGLYGIDEQGQVERQWPAAGTANISAIAQDRQQQLWLAVAGRGIAILDPTTQRTRWLQPDPLTPGSLPDATVTLLMLDRSGLMWVGTHDRGLSRTDSAGTPFRYLVDHNDIGQSGRRNDIRALAADAEGGLWIGDGRGLKHYTPGSKRFDYIHEIALAKGGRTLPAQELQTVSAIIPARQGNFWLASKTGVGLFDPARGTLTPLIGGEENLGNTQPFCLASGADQRLWIGTRRGGLARYEIDTGQWTWYRTGSRSANAIASNMILAVHEDRSGRVWVATMFGLNLIDEASGSIRLFRHSADDPRSLSSSTILAIHESGDGQLWFGTQGGLNRLDSLDARRASFSRWQETATSTGTIHSIEDDGLGHLWLGTSRGLAALDVAASRWQRFSLSEGLQGLNFNTGASTRLPNGELVFGGSDGINLFRPQGVVSSRYIAPVVVTRIQVGADEALAQAIDGTVTIPASERLVRFQFAALDYAAPDRNRFAYQLTGFDERWIESADRHEAIYTNLAPGTYIFSLRGSNHDGYWNPAVTRVDLVVLPAWWQSPPAKTLYALLAAGALFLLMRTQRRRRRAEIAHHHDLREREDRLRLALWGSGDDFWDWDMACDHMVLTGSRGLFSGTRMQTSIEFSRWFRANVHPADLSEVERRLDQHIRGQTDAYEAEYRIRNESGRLIWLLARGKIVERDAHNQPMRMCGTTRDITIERAAEQERRIAHEVFRSMGEAVIVNDLDFRFTTVNPAFTRITGWTQAEVEGQSLSLLDCAHHPAEIYRDLRKTIEASGQWRGELWQRRKNGEEFLSWCEVQEVRDASGARTHFVGVISDITDRKRTEQELRYLANYDALTGLPNRSLLIERIEQGIARARSSSRSLAVLFLDLDRFKHVNDSMGHSAGDSLLRAAGARLRQVVRGNDSVARIGGDEFTVVLEDIAGVGDAESVAGKILAAFEQPLELDNGQEVVISPSIGISLFPEHGINANDLLKYADTAMYQAKDHGRRTWMVYVEAMDAAARLRATTMAALRKALDRAEFHLRYQPKMSLRDNRITGFEALLRWRSGEIGDVAPGVFIPIAEETGMIVEIGNWVIEQVCRQLARWRAEGLVDITVSINLSVGQLMHADLIHRLKEGLIAHDLPPAMLELELTESMIMANAERSISTLQRLKDIGVSLSIDDFGTGYSSLSYLRRLPIDTLKIDKEFIDDLTTDPDDDAITATVIAMAHSLDLNVIAEGVEKLVQVDYLRGHLCDEIQGHWLAQPLLPEQCQPFVRNHARAQP